MEFLEIPLFDDDVYKLAVRFLFNLVFLFLMLFLAIKPGKVNHEFAFTVVMMNVTTFFICFALKKLDLGLGMALGLFAIFGVLRYRTDAIRPKEMTYLFIVIGIAVVNALSNKKTSYIELVFVNSAILTIAIFKESFLFKPQVQANPKPSNGKTPDKPVVKSPKLPRFSISYDRLELLDSGKSDQLMNDLKSRTHTEVSRFRIDHIDLEKGIATLTLWYVANENSPATG